MPDASMMRGQKSSHMGVTMETKVLLGTWDTEEEGELVGILSVSPARKSWLLAILFLGMMLGRYVWGSLGDTLGRRVVLINTLVNSAPGFLSSFSQDYYLFLLLRFISVSGKGHCS